MYFTKIHCQLVKQSDATSETYNYDIKIVGKMIGKFLCQHLIFCQTVKPITFLSNRTNICQPLLLDSLLFLCHQSTTAPRPFSLSDTTMPQSKVGQGLMPKHFQVVQIQRTGMLHMWCCSRNNDDQCAGVMFFLVCSMLLRHGS